jgi:photosystem II stability/assembly factor-like uncharacterized protein
MDSKKAMTLLQSKNRLLCLATGLVLLSFCSAMAQDWKATKFPINETITGIHFPTANRGYLVTSGGKYGVTRDGGKYWDVYQIEGATALEEVWFKSSDTGLAVGRQGRIFRTIKSGDEWENRSLKDSTVWLTSGIFLTDSIAIVTGLKPGSNMEGVLYRSTDGGKTWIKLDVPGMGFGELCAGKGIPVCFQSYGRLNFSTDRGASWQSLSTTSGKPGRATAFYNNTGIICGNDAMCAISSDRGKTWTPVPLEGGASLTSAVLFNDSLGYIAGTGGVLMVTQDGGKSWKKDGPLPEPVDIAKLAIAGNKLFAAGANGFVFYRPLVQPKSVKGTK